MNNNGVALVVEDDSNSAAAISRVVASLGYETIIASTLEKAKSEIDVRAPALVLLDLGLPDGDGLELTKHGTGAPKPHYIVITGNDSKEVVINSLRANVTDFLQKPVSLNDLKNCVTRITNRTDQAEQNPDQLPPLSFSQEKVANSVVLKGDSAFVTELRSSILNCSRTNLDSVISGELGSEKLALAYAVHSKSNRIGKYVCVEATDFEINAFNSSAGPEERDLSGLIKSWLTVAQNGTLVVNDLASIPLAQQRLLTRLLGEKTPRISNVVGVNEQPNMLPARIIGLLSEPWESAVNNGRLSPELYHRLAQYAISVPTLKQRIADISTLANSIIDRLNKEYETNKILTENSILRMEQYAWPGNLIELENILTQSFANSVQNIVIDPKLVPLIDTSEADSNTIDSLVGKSFWQVEKTLLFATLEHNNGDKTATAKSLGISLKTLYNRLNAYS